MPIADGGAPTSRASPLSLIEKTASPSASNYPSPRMGVRYSSIILREQLSF
jgi:hypothetical protein